MSQVTCAKEMLELSSLAQADWDRLQSVGNLSAFINETAITCKPSPLCLHSIQADSLLFRDKWMHNQLVTTTTCNWLMSPNKFSSIAGIFFPGCRLPFSHVTEPSMTKWLIKELTMLRMAISRVTSTQITTTNSLSAALVETPRDNPDIHWTLTGILGLHFCGGWRKKHTL